MPGFAERMGHRAARTLVQSESLDEETRTELWNVTNTLRTILRDKESETRSKTHKNVKTAIWTWEFKKPADEEPSSQTIWQMIKQTILTGEWWQVLDLIENLVGYVTRYRDAHTSNVTKAITDAFNNRFEHFLVDFRFISGEITQVGSTGEADAVASAIDDAATVKGARHSLERAVELLADRQNPDYPNSIKESISAVEAVVMKITGEGTLGAGLNKLEAAGLKIHPALKGAWSKMYGWTSDEDGIRHAGIEAADVDQALAKYALVTCSAFVSYLIEEGQKTGLL